jgi:hypothetical protein
VRRASESKALGFPCAANGFVLRFCHVLALWPCLDAELVRSSFLCFHPLPGIGLLVHRDRRECFGSCDGEVPSGVDHSCGWQPQKWRLRGKLEPTRETAGAHHAA